MTSKARLLGPGRALVYAVHDHRAPSDEDWALYLEACREAVAHCPEPLGAAGLSITDGGAPNAKQRREVIALVQSVYDAKVQHIRSAVLSDSAIVRGVVTAFSWHLPEIKIFAPSATIAALGHAHVLPADHATILEDLEELAKPLEHARAVRLAIDRIRAVR